MTDLCILFVTNAKSLSHFHHAVTPFGGLLNNFDPERFDIVFPPLIMRHIITYNYMTTKCLQKIANFTHIHNSIYIAMIRKNT